MWCVGSLVLACVGPCLAQELTQEFVGPPGPAFTAIHGPPAPILTAPRPELQFPLPNVPLLDQQLETLVRAPTDLDYLIPTPATVVKSMLGFALLLSLAVIAGHRRVTEVERKLGIAHLATTGLPFVLLGLVASQPEVGVLTPAVLFETAPLLTLGLGWVGFSIGYRFNAQLMENLPRGAGGVAGWMTVVPCLAVALAASAFMLYVHAGELDAAFVRDALMLGIAGAMTARSSPYLWRGGGFGDEDMERMGRIVQLERIMGILGLMAVAAYFRPEAETVSWQLPPAAWLFLTLGVGVALGAVIHAVLGTSRSDNESLVLLLGSISFAAGMAHYLRLSAISVCFLAGVVMANAPSKWSGTADAAAKQLERPVYFVFLIVAGAVWMPSDWRGLALMALFVAARLGGRRLAAGLVARQGRYESATKERQWLTYAPAGAISLAVVISAQNLYGGPRISWIVTAVIAGSLVNEILVQLVVRRRGAA